MSDKHSPFEARDLSPPVYKDRKGETHYTGPERRRGHRRRNEERRGAVRFDIKQPERRDQAGRREEDKAPKFW
ncbi:MAG: hypothetical protein RJQ10_09095 [Haliea sp.]|uniref:hypothetical protein n=1 Tax=Haliea sp. TaxID=1932666 RepID=UPI0032EF046C